jgi:hypothetical protein
MGKKEKPLVKRGSWRIEGKDPDSLMSMKTKIAIAQIFIDTGLKDIENKAEWKGYPSLSYNFNGTINNKKIVISFAFREQIVWVMVYEPKSTQGNYGFNIKNGISMSIQQQLLELKKKL